jgi:hypothetical protein
MVFERAQGRVALPAELASIHCLQGVNPYQQESRNYSKRYCQTWSRTTSFYWRRADLSLHQTWLLLEAGAFSLRVLSMPRGGNGNGCKSNGYKTREGKLTILSAKVVDGSRCWSPVLPAISSAHCK